MTTPLTAYVTVPLERGDAFELFTDGFADWWPPEFSWSGADGLQRIGIEPVAHGALYEIGPNGLRWDWGRVLSWEPPQHLRFSWQIGPDRVPVPTAEAASYVDVEVLEVGDAESTVTVEHAGWERHGDSGATYRDAFGQVWPYALERFAALARGETGSA